MVLKNITKIIQTEITEEGIDAQSKMSVKYMADKKLPDKAIDLIDPVVPLLIKKVEGEKIVGKAEIEFELAKAVKLSNKYSKNSNLHT